jgi:hypothetical protein
MCGIGTGLAICCKWKDHIAMKQTSSQNDLQNFASPPMPQFSATATAMPSAPPAMKITYE